VKPWKVLDNRVIVNRRWLCLHEQRVLLPNGTIIDEFHKFETPQWVAVIALTTDRQIVLVEQYRHGLGELSLELPAGVIDENETPEHAVKRELLEETGYIADTVVPLFEVSPEPHRSTCRAHFFIARDVKFSGEAHPEPSEVIAVSVRPLAEILETAANGGLHHAAHIGALLAAERRGLLT
jgi:8-oxo-dGTP pyrophosphatase MutT (NUDIX family)